MDLFSTSFFFTSADPRSPWTTFSSLSFFYAFPGDKGLAIKDAALDLEGEDVTRIRFEAELDPIDAA